MIVLFEKKFLKNIDALEDKELKQLIEQTIVAFEQAKDFRQIRNLKKLKGHKSAYRVRMGEYRLGFFYEKRKVIFTCFLHRKDIYKYFP
jgi:mRNA interferase RelE/StbE